MSGSLSSFLVDTLLWTGALIAVVLVLRRPVARHFGAQAAYALWFVPLLRLAFPPIELPAWLRPAAETAMPVEATIDASFAPIASESVAPVMSTAGLPAAAPVDLLTPLLLVWVAGAAVFLARRFELYFRMRRELLENARPMGEAGKVRLVESPAISGPVAFGVRDKVVALPLGFMAGADRQTRDLALAHELAHHRGHDLLVNFMVQPLFALHWFNPLGWAGWRALRRDQEAACDARVVAHRSQPERAAYAGIIADFACRSGQLPRAALAAPMACPVLGDKSIIHRLRSLTMTDISPRRRMGARLSFAAALLVLPLTASISYAEAGHNAPPPPPAAPEPSLPPEGPSPPEAPRPPDAVDALTKGEHRHDGDEHRAIAGHIERDGEHSRIERRVVRRFDHAMTPDERAQLERDLAQMREELAESRVEIHRDVRIAMAEARTAAHMAPKVVTSCRDRDQPVTSETDEHGRTTLFVCESFGDRIALDAIRRVRERISDDPHMPDDERAEVLRSLDEEIEHLSD